MGIRQDGYQIVFYKNLLEQFCSRMDILETKRFRYRDLNDYEKDILKDALFDKVFEKPVNPAFSYVNARVELLEDGCYDDTLYPLEQAIVYRQYARYIKELKKQIKELNARPFEAAFTKGGK